MDFHRWIWYVDGEVSAQLIILMTIISTRIAEGFNIINDEPFTFWAQIPFQDFPAVTKSAAVQCSVRGVYDTRIISSIHTFDYLLAFLNRSKFLYLQV